MDVSVGRGPFSVLRQLAGTHMSRALPRSGAHASLQADAVLGQQRMRLVAELGAAEVEQAQVLLEVKPVQRAAEQRPALAGQMLEQRLRQALEAREPLGKAHHAHARLQLFVAKVSMSIRTLWAKCMWILLDMGGSRIDCLVKRV